MGKTNHKATLPNNINNTAQTVYKMVFIGNHCDGRTTLLTRLTTNAFVEVEGTIGANFFAVQHKNCKFQFWDTAGLSNYDRITLSYTRGSHLIMISVDSTNTHSIARVREWKQKLFEQYGANKLPPIMLVLTKCDIDRPRVVTKKQLVTLALELKAKIIYEVSAKTGDNIDNFIPTLHSLVTSQGPDETSDLSYYKNNGVEVIPINNRNIFIGGITQAGKKSCLTAMLPTSDTRYIMPPYVYQMNLANNEALNAPCDGLLFVVDANNINSLLSCGQLLTIELARLSSNSAPKFLIVNKFYGFNSHVITPKLLIKFAQKNHFCAVIEIDGLRQQLATAILPLLHQHFTQPASTPYAYYALSGATETYQYIFSFHHPNTIWFPSSTELRSDNDLVHRLQLGDYRTQATLVWQRRQTEIAEQQRQREIAEQQKREDEERQRERDEDTRIDALPDDKKCQICFFSDDIHALTPCGHYPICKNCANVSGENCPTCKSKITKIIKLNSTVLDTKKCQKCSITSDDLHVILPCRHNPICKKCIDKCGNKCPTCNSGIVSSIKLYSTV